MPKRVDTLIQMPVNESTYVSLADCAWMPEGTADGRVLFAVKSGRRWLLFTCRDCSPLDYCDVHQPHWSNYAALASLLRMSDKGRGRVVGDGSEGTQGDSAAITGAKTA